MATFKRFEDIEAWKKVRELAKAVYEIWGRGAFAKDYVLRDQVRRAAVSVMSNIAEGLDRSGSREFGQLLAVAKGSSAEARSGLCVALDQGYVSQSTFEELAGHADEVGRPIGGLMGYLRHNEIRGPKFRRSARSLQRETPGPKLETG